MKIFFEDGPLRDFLQLPVIPDFIMNADEGITRNINFLDNLLEQNSECTVYTNSIVAFSNKYAWNKELAVPEIYIRAGEHELFTRIDKLTARVLKEGRNLSKLYIGGDFNS